MPTTNLPLQNFTGIAYPQVGSKVRLLIDKTSDAGVDFDAGTEITMSGSVEINLLQSYNILKFTSGGQIQIIKPVTINVDWEPVSHVVDLVEGVDYEIEYNDAVNIPFWLETGTPFRSQDRGEIGGGNAVKRRTASSQFNMGVEAKGGVKFATKVTLPVSIDTDPVVHQRVRFGSTMINMSFPYRTYIGISAIKKAYAQIGMGVSINASGNSVIKKGYAQIGTAISVSSSGVNPTKNGAVSINLSLGVTAQGSGKKFESTDVGRVIKALVTDNAKNLIANRHHVIESVSGSTAIINSGGTGINIANENTNWEFYDTPPTYHFDDDGTGIFEVESDNYVGSVFNTKFTFNSITSAYAYRITFWKDITQKTSVVVMPNGTSTESHLINLETGDRSGVSSGTAPFTLNETAKGFDVYYAFYNSIQSPDGGTTLIDQDDASGVAFWKFKHPLGTQKLSTYGFFPNQHLNSSNTASGSVVAPYVGRSNRHIKLNEWMVPVNAVGDSIGVGEYNLHLNLEAETWTSGSTPSLPSHIVFALMSRSSDWRSGDGTINSVNAVSKTATTNLTGTQAHINNWVADVDGLIAVGSYTGSPFWRTTYPRDPINNTDYLGRGQLAPTLESQCPCYWKIPISGSGSTIFNINITSIPDDCVLFFGITKNDAGNASKAVWIDETTYEFFEV
jgi:hypothetical protein